MSASCGYLVPDKSFPAGQFKKAIKTLLETDKVINGYYDEKQGTLAAGHHSFSIFQDNLNNSNIAFEYGDIHDTNNNRLIPEGSSEGYGANCVYCNKPIDDELLDVLNDLYEKEYDSGLETDMTGLEISCGDCMQVNKLSEIQFTQDVEIKNQYIQFVDIESNFDLSKVEEIGKRLNCTLKVFYDRI